IRIAGVDSIPKTAQPPVTHVARGEGGLTRARRPLEPHVPGLERRIQACIQALARENAVQERWRELARRSGAACPRARFSLLRAFQPSSPAPVRGHPTDLG